MERRSLAPGRARSGTAGPQPAPAATAAAAPKVVKGVCHHDCPDSCVWEVTVVGEGADARAVKLRGDPSHPFTRGELCPKVNRFLERVYHPDRLLHPLVRVGPKGAGEFRRASWDEALDTIAGALRERITRHGPATVLPFGYAGIQGQVQMAAMSERFFNRMGASVVTGGVCGNVALAGVRATQGTGLGVDPEDVRHARTILLWGTNTVVTNRHLWPVIQDARAAGAEVICVDPLRTLTAANSDRHVQLLPGTDAALAMGMISVIIRDGLVDTDYVERHTVGFEDLAVRAKAYPPERVAEICGLDAEVVVDLAHRFATQRPAVIRILIGMEHRAGGGMAIRTLACLPALVGAWRDRGGGLCRSVGSTFDELWDPTVLTRPDLAPGPRREVVMGHLGRALVDPALAPPVTALVVFSCNPATTAPNAGLVRAGLARDDLFTVVAEQFLTDTARWADVVLPATTQIEHLDLMAPWGHTYLTLNRPAIPPRGEALPNSEIFRRLARAMGYDEPAFADSDEQIARDLLASGHSPLLDGITYERLEREASVRLARPEDWRPFRDGGFPTPSGRLELRADHLAAAGIDPLPGWAPATEGPHGDPALRARFPLACITTKSQLRFLNSSYSYLPRHLADEGRPLLDIDPADAAARGITDGDPVRVWNDRGKVHLHARISDRVRPGVVAMPFGWPRDAAGGIGCNAITNDGDTDLGGGTAFHDNLVEVARDDARPDEAAHADDGARAADEARPDDDSARAGHGDGPLRPA